MPRIVPSQLSVTRHAAAASLLLASLIGLIALPLWGGSQVGAATRQLVLCDGRTYSNVAGPVIHLTGKHSSDGDAAVQKVIRNCTFRNITGGAAISLDGARNVRITGSTFDNVHSGSVGKGAVGIYLHGSKTIDDVIISGNRFSNISADGVQMSDAGRLVSNVLVANNVFTAPDGSKGWTGGENAIDVKGVNGPVVIRGNRYSGFRACNGSRDQCSGSTGVGLVVHEGSPSGRARNVTVTANYGSDNVTNLAVHDADNITVTDNVLKSSAATAAQVSFDHVSGCRVGSNTLLGTRRVQNSATDCRIAQLTGPAPSSKPPKSHPPSASGGPSARPGPSTGPVPGSSASARPRVSSPSAVAGGSATPDAAGSATPAAAGSPLATPDRIAADAVGGASPPAPPPEDVQPAIAETGSGALGGAISVLVVVAVVVAATATMGWRRRRANR
jgi:hypothetical protein